MFDLLYARIYKYVKGEATFLGPSPFCLAYDRFHFLISSSRSFTRASRPDSVGR